MHALNPWFLAGLLLVAVPVLIHLLQRQRIRKVLFPATRFLLGASRAITRTQQMRERLLLAARIAAVALAALACARPFFARGADAAAIAAGVPGGATVVLLDVSASMRIGTRMEDARAAALAALDGLRPGLDRAALVVSGGDGQVRVPLGDDLERVREAVRTTAVGWGAGDLAADLQVCDRLLQDDAAHALSKRIVVASDLQRAGDGRPVDGWRLSPGVELVVRAVAKGQADDVAIVKATIPQGAVVSPRPRPISVQVANLGAVDHPGVAVALSIRGAKVAEKSVNLPAGATEVVRFEQVFAEAGDFPGAITAAANDDFADDDSWYIDVPVRPRVEVLLIDGAAGASAARDDGRFVREALSLPDSPFQVRAVAATAVAAKDLDGVQAVITANVGALPAPVGAALERFVAGGGGLLAFCGDRVAPAEFNASFAKLAPCTLRSAVEVGDAGGATLGEIDLSHPIFQLFTAPQSGDFASARFQRCCLVADSQASRVLARFIDGRPALLEATVGAGTSLLFTSSAGLEWSDFCLQGGIFVPFLHEAIRYLSVHTTAPTNLEVGAAYAVPGATVSRPDGTAAGATVDKPGLHRVIADGAESSLAVNVPRSESAVGLLDATELSTVVAADPVGREQQLDGGRALILASESVRERLESGQRIGFALLIAVLALLLAEHLLANATARA